MIRLEYLGKEDIGNIIEWNKNKSKDFLVQWAGDKIYKYPITEEQIKKRLVEEVNKSHSNSYIFKIVLSETNEIIGTVELFQVNYEKKTAKVARFLIGDLELRGKGYGKLALTKLVDMAFNKFGLEKVDLSVFDFNESAIKCYENVGFIKESYREKIHESENGTYWNSYIMSIKKKI